MLCFISQKPADVATRPYGVDETERWDLWLTGSEFQRYSKNFCSENCIKNSHEEMNVIAANSPEIVIAELCNNGQNFMQHALNRTRKMTKAIQVVTIVLKSFSSWKQKALKATTSMIIVLTNFM